jgi:hypothetical protein
MNDLFDSRGGRRFFMRPNEIVVGGYYVMQGGGSIHHFYATDKYGKAWYRAYDMYDGSYILTIHCSMENLVWKAERKATTEEISKIDQPDFNLGLFPGRKWSLRDALRSTSKK